MTDWNKSSLIYVDGNGKREWKEREREMSIDCSHALRSRMKSKTEDNLLAAVSIINDRVRFCATRTICAPSGAQVVHEQ